MIKEPVVNVEEYPMQGENGNSIFVIGGYKFTAPKEVNALLIQKERRRFSRVGKTIAKVYKFIPLYWGIEHNFASLGNYLKNI